MSVAIITGASGLIGSEAVRFFSQQGLDIVGIDNDMRAQFFGADASTSWNLQRLKSEVPNFTHENRDIRDETEIERIFKHYGANIATIIHCAAQPSHDWAARDPIMDFSINANGTLVLLEATRNHCPNASFIYLSTNKVYGDQPNSLPLVETETRWTVAENHPFSEYGIDETMSIDACLHSLFGASKASADLLVQEYGRYFGINTVCFRGGCLTGPAHSGAELHGFLAYLVKCAVTDTPYTVFGYKGKQVRDNIHSHDLVQALWCVFQSPKPGAVYNIGGGVVANCSVLEAVALLEELNGKTISWSYSSTNRIGDHIWWVSDTRRFQSDYPSWTYKYDLRATIVEMFEALRERENSSRAI